MTVSAQFAPVLARMAVSTLRECLPFLSTELRAELADMLEPRAPVAAAQLACERAGEAQQGTIPGKTALRGKV